MKIILGCLIDFPNLKWQPSRLNMPPSSSFGSTYPRVVLMQFVESKIREKKKPGRNSAPSPTATEQGSGTSRGHTPPTPPEYTDAELVRWSPIFLTMWDSEIRKQERIEGLSRAFALSLIVNIDKTYYIYVDGLSSPREILKALKTYVAPPKHEVELYLRQQYRNLTVRS